MIEGGVDSIIFENFLYQTLMKIRLDPQKRDKQIVVLLDNASIHKVSTVFDTARKMKATVLMNA